MSQFFPPPKQARRARRAPAAAAKPTTKGCWPTNVQSQAGLGRFPLRRAALAAYFISRILPTFGTIGKPGRAGTPKPAGQYTKNALPISAYRGTVPSW